MQKKSWFKGNLKENKIGCYAEFISASHLVSVFKSGGILKQVQDDTVFYNSVKGFTLIELLVVVLIIGILAAVAVPQYQKAVWKSRNVQLKMLISSLLQAQNAYYMANGVYAKNFDELDLEVPLVTTSSSCGISNANGMDSVRAGNETEFVITSGGNIIGLWTKGPYRCNGFQSYQQKLICLERVETEKSFCGSLEKATLSFTSGGYRHYNMP